MRHNKSSSILVAGSSPVSLLYALLLRKMEYEVTIATGKTFGGAWRKQKHNLEEELSTGTHILMHSVGLSELLNFIGFNATKWSSYPALIDAQGNHLDHFGQSKNEFFIGDISGESDFIAFLNKEINSDSGIKIINLSINSLDVGETIFCSIQNKKYEFHGVVLPNGVNLELNIDGKKINFFTKDFLVQTFSMEVKYEKAPPSNSFVHIKDKESVIREIQLYNYSNGTRILAKLGREGIKKKESQVLDELKKIVERIWSVEIFEETVTKYKYRNLRNLPLIETQCYEEYPLIVPGYTLSNDLDKRILLAQDLSLIFEHLHSIKSEITEKF